MIKVSQCKTIMLAIFIITAVVFSLAACSKSGKGLTLKDISVYDTVSKSSIYLGIGKSDAEKILGKPKDVQDSRSDYGDVVVVYKDDIAVQILLQKSEASKSQFTFYNSAIKIGDPKGTATDKLGEGSKSIVGASSGSYFNYCYELKEGSLQKLDQMPSITPETTNVFYYITVYLSEDGKNITKINLTDGSKILSRSKSK